MTRTHSWPADTRAVETPREASLSARMGLPPGTIAFLRLAFQLGLPRGTTWSCDDLPPAEREAALAAARVFRRGSPDAAGPQREQPIPEYPPSAMPLPDPDTFVVADVSVARLWPDVGRAARSVVPDGESRKTLETVAAILDDWRAAGRPERWLVYGGGHALDIAGFAGALGGCPVHAIPTTLLAMVDAAIGGKTGVNFPPWGKNQVGLFSHPERLSIWPGWLATLDTSALRSQGAECVKHAWIQGDARLLEDVVTACSASIPDNFGDRSVDAWSAVIHRVADVKRRVVERDPLERGERAVLNLGHTLGHALETLSEERSGGDSARILNHGQAVAAGLAFALRLSRRLAALDAPDERLMRESLTRAGLWPPGAFTPIALHDDSTEERLWQLIAHDKKRRGPHSEWVLLRGFGKIADHEKPGTFLCEVSRDAFSSEWTSFRREFPTPGCP